MDIVLEICDKYFLTPYVYPTSWTTDNIFRQYLSLLAIATVGAWLLYISTATLGYIFLFDHSSKKHPQFLNDQVKLEIIYASKSIPLMGVFTALIFIFEVRGYSKLYWRSDIDPDSFYQSWIFICITIVSFLMFTDGLIYWIHRGLHYRWFYKYIHKDHHKWKISTPFASHAFHPLDGFFQSVPYHIYPFLFPTHKVAYLLLFMIVNVWTVSIHDGYYCVPKLLQPFINGSAHHTDHHLFYKYNYGQFFTLWDHLGGSYQYPTALASSTCPGTGKEASKSKKQD